MPAHTLKALTRWLNRPTAPAGRPRLGLEELGDRALPSAVVAVPAETVRPVVEVDNGVTSGYHPADSRDGTRAGLYITGSPLDDRVTVTQNGTTLTVVATNARGVRTTVHNGVDPNAVIWFYGRAGDDLFDAPKVSLPVIADGEAGNDTLRGGAGRDALFGGDGDDDLYGNDGDDRLGQKIVLTPAVAYTWSGGTQAVSAYMVLADADAGKNRMWGGAGDDVVVGGPDLDAVDPLKLRVTKWRTVATVPGVVVLPTDPLVLAPLPPAGGPVLTVDGAAVVKP